jgi:ribosomal protein S18 acetylase RimI-like enzyme
MDIKIMRMTALNEEMRKDVARVLVLAFSHNLSFLSKDIEVLASAFFPWLDPETVYVALMGNKVVGLVGMSTNKNRVITVTKKECRKAFGFFKGSIGYYFLNKEFNKLIEYDNNTVYIQCVATHPDYHHQGVAKKIFEYIFENHKYHFILEVTDTNSKAISLYNKIGFKESKRIKEKHPRITGFNYRIYMER